MQLLLTSAVSKWFNPLTTVHFCKTGVSSTPDATNQGLH